MALLGERGDRLRLPCFAYDERSERLALPSFGQLTAAIPCPPQERLWLVAEGSVLAGTPARRRRG